MDGVRSAGDYLTCGRPAAGSVSNHNLKRTVRQVSSIPDSTSAMVQGLKLPPGCRPLGSMAIETGRLTRDPLDRGSQEGLTRWATRGKAVLTEMLKRCGTTEDPAMRALCVWGEALQNAYEHARAPYLRYCITIDEEPRPGAALPAERVKLVAIYRTRRFDTHPPEPDLYAQRGRGILLMRELCRAEDGRDQTMWRFNGAELWLTLVVTT